MTVLRQVGLLFVALALMLAVAPYAPAAVFVVAAAGGHAVSQYDDGRKHR